MATTRFANPLRSALHTGDRKQVRRLARKSQEIIALEPTYAAMSDDELRASTANFKKMLAHDATLDDLLADAFAVVREASWRVLGKKHFNVQLMGGIALHEGNIAEMKTGEGKALTITLPSYLHALNGENVHVITVNDFLASEQSAQMKPLFDFLDITIGCVLDGMKAHARTLQYNCDITYGTANQFGFDYLRDNMVYHIGNCVQRGQHYAIVDEIDSVLIDEARTPLVIASSPGRISRLFHDCASIAEMLETPKDFEFDEKKKTVSLHEDGIEFVEDCFGIENMFADEQAHLVNYMNNAIKARVLFKKNRDYIVTDEGKIELIDEHTGRVLEGRSYNDGLHQAIEAREGVEISGQTTTMASTTLQNYFKLYDRLCGTTGTAQTAAGEFTKTYGMHVIQIPTNRGVQRIDAPDIIYPTKAEKIEAIVADVKAMHATGRPVLVGTASVAESYVMSDALSDAGLTHATLNAENNAIEAEIIACAGERGAITVATNMAGRGTDILLGGNPDQKIEKQLLDLQADIHVPVEMYDDIADNIRTTVEAACRAEKAAIVALGGLHVIGSERHESSRIDNQLRGRAGRQGDPGSSQFYVSLEDPLIRLFAPNVNAMLHNFSKGGQIVNSSIARSIDSAQNAVESKHTDERKDTIKYDDVISKQRNVIYSERRAILTSQLDTQVRSFAQHIIEKSISDLVSRFATEEEIARLIDHLSDIYPVNIKADDLIASYGSVEALTPQVLFRELMHDAGYSIDARVDELIEHRFDPSEAERGAVLVALDTRWREHLNELDALREAVGLRGIAQKEPVAEFQRDAAQMYEQMRNDIRQMCVSEFFGGEQIVNKYKTMLATKNISYVEHIASLRKRKTKNTRSRLTIVDRQKLVSIEFDDEGTPIIDTRKKQRVWREYLAHEDSLG